MFKNAFFIKSSKNFDLSFIEDKNLNPLFRKNFTLDKPFKTATLSFCALGLGYAFINGQDVTDELFAPPYADYEKRLWYVSYDVSNLVNQGKNVLAFSVGNGFYNEDVPSVWENEKASWRDQPKVIATLFIDGEPFLNTDDSFVCTTESPYVMNRLRTGVIYDARKYCKEWNAVDYDASDWVNATIDDTPPTGSFSLCTLRGMKEYEKYAPVNVIKKGNGRVIFDFGYNHAGIIHFSTKQKAGDMITFRYAESLDGNLNLNYRGISGHYYHTEQDMDRYICDGKGAVWANRFSYHGFRFVEAEGMDLNCEYEILSVYVHQDIERRSSFACSNENLNQLFACGVRATLSNMYYMPTDCPTREKLGWMNDAQSSCEQFLTNFKLEDLLSKWVEDMKDAMKESGELPGIVPTHGWGYRWGNGPVSDGCFFETPYRIYLHSGNSDVLKSCIPYYHRYFDFLESREDENGLVNFGLHDWANPRGNREMVPTALINAALRVKFSRIAALACEMAGENAERFKNEEIRQRDILLKTFIGADGKCLCNEQTACAMLIYYGIGDKAVLGEQLLALVQYEGYHHTCGMVGLRHLYMALTMTGHADAAYDIITNKGYPSYHTWLLNGATTLFELFDCEASKNHHMYSDFMSWLMKTVVGISPDDNASTFDKVEIAPVFFDDLSFARGSYDSVKGNIEVDWKRNEDKTVCLKIVAPENDFVYYNGQALAKGENVFRV